MNWETLYTTRRTGIAGSQHGRHDPVRSAFQKDYDRVIFSSPFRRLQNKTQVFPLPGSVFVHNRLTHSLEVASVGRSLGKAAGEAIAARHSGIGAEFEEFYRHELASVIAAACLAHDIGNPPFGHSGEDAIRTFFKELEGDARTAIYDNLSAGQISDLERFEGNSNALRVLTHSYNEPEPGGYRLTLATLAAIIKYPSSSAEGFDKTTNLIATKKSGYFTSETETFRSVATHTGMRKTDGFNSVYDRHPFVYLTEAADDICYRVIDLEDAHRLHIVSTNQFNDLFLPFFEIDEGAYVNRNYVERKLANIIDPNRRVQYIRALWIGRMTEKVVRVFAHHEQELLAGTLQKSLLQCLEGREVELLEAIDDFSVRHIYNYRSVVEIELAGYNVIGGLLKEFVHALLHPSGSRSVKLLKLVAPQFPLSLQPSMLFNDIFSIVDFIAGMSDLYAIELYRKITGITIPEIL